MVLFFLGRDSGVCDPLRVIEDATLQATAERAAQRLGLEAAYRYVDGIIELFVKGAGDVPTRGFFEALKASRIFAQVDVDTRAELLFLGNAAEGQDLRCRER